MSRAQCVEKFLWVGLVSLGFLAAPPALANQPPVAVDDRVVVRGTAFVLIDVLANDSDADGDPLTVTATGGAAVTNLGDGLFRFQPTVCLWAPESFTYQVEDGTASASATVHLIEGGCQGNFNVLALPDEDWTPPDTPVVVDVLENDSDPDGDPLCVSEVDQMVHGVAEIAADCLTVTFTPDPGYQGNGAGFRYRVQDGRGGEAEAPVSVTVDTDPDNPDLPADQFTTERDKILPLPAAVLLGNDGAGLTFVDAFSDAGDVLDVIRPPGGDPVVLYHPPAGFVGTRQFTYEAVDTGGLAHYGSVTVRILTPVGTMRAADDFLLARRDGCLVADFESLLANDQGGGLGVESYQILAQPLLGSLTVVASTPSLVVSYDAPAGYTGKDFFTYLAEDELTNADVATVVVDVRSGASAPHRPAAAADIYRVTGTTNPLQLILDVLINDYDPDCGALTVSIATPPSLGTVSVRSDGSLRYVPYPDATGPDTFTYQVQDTDGETATALITVHLVDEVPPPGPRFWYTACEDYATCWVDARDSRRGDGGFFPFGPHLCNLAWYFEGATPPPGDVADCRGGVPLPTQQLRDYYSEPGLHRVELTLWHHGHRVSYGRWVPVGGTMRLPIPPFDIACQLEVCTFTPRGNYLDGTVDRFEWFFDATRPTGPPHQVTTTAEPVTHTFQGAIPGQTFRVWLTHFPFEGTAIARYLDVTIPDLPPAAPGNLRFEGWPPCDISGPVLAWQDLSDNEDGFRVLRSVNGGLFTIQAVLGAGATSYIDHYVGPYNDELTYHVAAFNAFGETSAGPIAGFRNPIVCESGPEDVPLWPLALEVAGSAGGGVTLAWTDASNNEDGFRVYRTEGSSPATLVGTAGADSTSYFDGGLIPGTRYIYRVAAYNINGEGEMSVPVTFTLEDAVFADGFETWDTSRWSAVGGNLAVTPSASLFGNLGLQVGVDPAGSPAVVDDSPASEPRYRARFYLDTAELDTSGLGIGTTELLTLLEARTEGGSQAVFALRLFPAFGGKVQIEGIAYGTGDTRTTPRTDLPGRPTAVEVEWWQHPGSGGLRLWLDGELVGETPAVANGSLAVGEVHLGALGARSGTAGMLRIDEFASRRASFLGAQGLAGEVLTDDFEDGGFLSWKVTQGSGGSISASPLAALSGELGVLISLDAGQTAFLEQDLGTSENHLLARFLVDAGVLSMGPGNEVRLLSGTVTGATDPAFTVRLRNLGVALGVAASAGLDSGDRAATAELTLPGSGSALVELEWHAARPGEGDGFLRLKVRDPATGAALAAEALNLGNEAQRVELLRLGQGVPAGQATQGTMALDRIEMWR